MSKTLVERRLAKKPDYELEVWIRGIRIGNGDAYYEVTVEGEDNPIIAAGILERAVEVLRDP